MPELSVVVVALDDEQRTLLQVLVDGTSVARVVHTASSFPMAPADPVVRRIENATPDVVLLDVPAANPNLALRGIEMLHAQLPQCALFAIGDMNQPQVIVNAMRSGA